MDAAGTGGAPKRGRLIAIICSIAAPFVLYLVVRAAVAGLHPPLAAQLPPSNEGPLARRLAVSAAHPQFRVTEAIVDLGRRAATSDPLSASPYFIAARAAEQKGDLRRAIVLMEEARRRRPDSILTRLQLIAYYSQTGRERDLIPEIDYTLRVSEQTRIGLLPELVRLLAVPGARRQLAALLAANPPWKPDFFNVARDRRVAPAHALDLLRLAGMYSRDVSAEERLYVHSLIGTGRYDLARARWLRSLSAPEQARSRLIFNGNFRSGLSSPDFGWALHSLDVGRADIVSSREGQSHLSVQYHGGSSAVLAQQQLALPPGRYRIAVTGRGNSKVPTGQLFWILSCTPNSPELVRLAAAATTPQARTVSGAFSVPPGRCFGQMLSLAAEPGEIAALTEAEFLNIEIADAR